MPKPRDFLDDKVAKAVDAVEQKADAEAHSVEMVGLQFPLMTGRPVQISIPKDISDDECFNLMVNIVAIRDRLKAERTEQAAGGLVIARQLPK